ncbi:MAG: hypothetical protein ACYCSN_08825 [Acidobacteriaceae bacterium]
MRIPIVMIGNDADLLFYRAAVLRCAGWQTVIAAPSEVETLMVNQGNFPLAIFCTTLSPVERSSIVALFRQRSPETKLLLLLRGQTPPPDADTFDETMFALDGPTVLIGVVQRLAS